MCFAKFQPFSSLQPPGGKPMSKAHFLKIICSIAVCFVLKADCAYTFCLSYTSKCPGSLASLVKQKQASVNDSYIISKR